MSTQELSRNLLPLASCLYSCPVSQHCVSRRLWHFVSSLFVLKNRWQWWSLIPGLTSVSAHLPWWPALLPDWWISPDLTRICCPHRRKSRKGFKKKLLLFKESVVYTGERANNWPKQRSEYFAQQKNMFWNSAPQHLLWKNWFSVFNKSDVISVMSANDTCEHILNIAIYLWKKARGHLPTFAQLYCISLNFTSSYSTSFNLPNWEGLKIGNLKWHLPWREGVGLACH